MTSIWRTMPSTPFIIPAPANADNGGRRPLLCLGLALLLFIAAACGSLHNHHDLADHGDCAICAVAHQPAATPASPALAGIPAAAMPVLLALPVLRAPVFGPISLLRSRAPPR